jgi:hypothetical protein
MGILILQVPNSRLGLKGQKPPFNTVPVPPKSLHQTYSVDGNPAGTRVIGINQAHPLPMPSRLDEWDANNNNKYKSQFGRRYLDNLPK